MSTNTAKFDVEKVNALMREEGFVEKLKSILSDSGSNEEIIKLFGENGVKLENSDVEDFKATLSSISELSEEELNVAGGKIGVEDSFKNIGQGVGNVVGSAIKGVATVVKGTAVGVGRTAWGVVEIPVSLVYDVGKGLYKGVKKSLR